MLTKVRIGTALCNVYYFVKGEFQNRSLASQKRGNIGLALLNQGLKLADITSAVTVLKITHFTTGAGAGEICRQFADGN